MLFCLVVAQLLLECIYFGFILLQKGKLAFIVENHLCLFVELLLQQIRLLIYSFEVLYLALQIMHYILVLFDLYFTLIQLLA